MHLCKGIKALKDFFFKKKKKTYCQVKTFQDPDILNDFFALTAREQNQLCPTPHSSMGQHQLEKPLR